MLYELHLTTKPDVNLADWIGWANRNGQKALDIRLVGEDAVNPRQIMTAGTFEGIDSMAFDWVTGLQNQMLAAGFPIERAKLEVPLDKSGFYHGRVRYYETHVKSLVEDRYYKDVLLSAMAEGWIVSYNDLYTEVDGLNKVYLTKRIDGGWPYLDAAVTFNYAFKYSLPHQDFHAVRMESEAVIVDSNPLIDEGWSDL